MPANAGASSGDLQDWLRGFLTDAGAVAGTVHLHEAGGLRLAADINIPPPLRQAVEWVPTGKGMAGLALERGQPMQTCNLQEDRSAEIKPGAKAVGAKAAVALPVRGPGGGIVAIVGAAWMQELELDAATVDRLLQSAARLTDVVPGDWGVTDEE